MNELTERLYRNLHDLCAYSILSDADRQRPHRPGGWSVAIILGHVADAELVLGERLRRIISEDRPQIRAFDENAWATAMAYQQMPSATVFALFEGCRLANIDLIDRLGAASAARMFVHSETGERTFAQESEKICAHAEHHLGHIRTALALP